MHILIVEDDRLIAENLYDFLEFRGHQCDFATSLAAARPLLADDGFDALILDRNLPDGDGATLARSLRSAGKMLPILMLTARDALDDKLAGFDAGADDYLAKPFDLDELEARVRALYRRRSGAGNDTADESPQWGQLRFDKATGAVYHHHKVLDLTPRELALMHALMAKPGHAVTKERLFEVVFPGETEVQYEAIEVVVYRLRKKLAETGAVLMTLRGLGYLLKSGA